MKHGLAVVAALMMSAAASAQQPPVLGIEEIYRLDLLPRFKQSVKVASVSSYDRTGGNDDGFSGKYSFLRKEGDGLVIADLKGPGVIYRIWTPTPTDHPIEFYFDGETTPRIKHRFRDIFDGEHSPFVAPLSGFGAGGFYTYLPLAYRASCKVIIRAPQVQFYQINYATYPEGTPIRSYSAETFAAEAPQRERAQTFVRQAGHDISQYGAPGASLKTIRVSRKLETGKPVTLFESKRGGRILGIRLSPASAFEDKERGTLLRMVWDGQKEPAVNVPAGDFFGYSWGETAMRSILAGTAGDTCYAYFPMPYSKSARIELVPEGTASTTVHAEIITADSPRRPDEGYFHALWRRENPTTRGKPFTFVETQGRGHIVGAALQAQGSLPGITPFFEGDDQATIDGELTIHGTGSEDFFNGGWYDVPGRWETRISFPFSGALDYKRPMGRSGGYRIFLGDAMAFKKSILLTIEHAPERNEYDGDYAGMTYLYLDRPGGNSTIPALAQRRVADPPRLVFNPGWYMPIHAFSIQNATLTKKNERINNQEVRSLSMRATDSDIFGLHSISLLADVPATGRYRVSVEVMQGPDQGILQLFHQERAAGPAFDMYADSRKRSASTPMGALDMTQGTNQVFFKLVGKNQKAAGMAVDLITIILERE